MKPSCGRVPCFALVALHLLLLLRPADSSAATAPLEVTLRPAGTALELTWPATVPGPAGTPTRPWFEVQSSPDLRTWQPVGERLRTTNPNAMEGTTLRQVLPAGEAALFYRVLATTPTGTPGLAQGGPEVFGYSAAFDQELERVGPLSPEAFVASHPSGAAYLQNLSWDPTTATFWDLFNADPQVVNVGKAWGTPGYRIHDYRLNNREREAFQRHGFVVSPRLGALGSSMFFGEGASPGSIFYHLWHNDLPVFISTDALLHAWHRTYELILEETEETLLHDAIQTLLQQMSDQIPAAWATAGAGPLQDSLRDADYFLTVARSLFSDRPLPSHLGQDAKVAATFTEIRSDTPSLKRVPDFMGFCRTVDFSQFAVRGHYTHTVRLQRYFRCLMWLGRIDIPVAGGPFERCEGDSRMTSPRELGTAIVLHQLLTDSGGTAAWQAIERTIAAFAGWSDSLTFAQLGGLLAGAGIHGLQDITQTSDLEHIQSLLQTGGLGVQNIRSDAYFTPLSATEPSPLPQIFAFLGQRFVPDSWAFSKTVFDSIRWTIDGRTTLVQRRVPSALDAAFAILANDQTVPELFARMTNTAARTATAHAVRFRDGLPYQHNLAAIRAVMDAQSPDAWRSNIYMDWLACLRELSEPTTDPRFPEAMRTRAWAMKTLNTQLASWSQLRHDTVLYAKQSYTGTTVCFYPAGYVEPRVPFWERLRDMAGRAASTLEALPAPGSYPVPVWVHNPLFQTDFRQGTRDTPLSEIRSNQVAHLRHFSAVADRLATMAGKELRQVPFDESEELFIRNLVQNVGWLTHGSGRTEKYSGWYPSLFYLPVHLPSPDDPNHGTRLGTFQSKYGMISTDLIVTDVHTDVPDPNVGDPGSVLHQGLGPAHLMVIAIDNGPDRAVYAGPVLNHQEFEVIGSPRRLTDQEWHRIILGETLDLNLEGLGPTAWTRDYLVP